MGPNERLAGIGALVVIASLLLPWYGAPIASLVKTGFGAFSFATAAMVLTAGACIYLIVEVGNGYRPPRPLTVGTLLIVAGVWAGLLILYQMVDRPNFDFAGVNDDYNVRYGTFVALGGAAAMILAGTRRRVREAAGHAAHDDDHLDDVDLGEDD
jgi:hypothetical protein